MKKADYTLLSIIFALIGLGLLFLSGISAIYSFRQFGTTTYYLNRQLISIVLGIIIAFTIYKIPFSFLKKLAFPGFLFTIFLNFLIMIPKIGIEIGGARRWLNLGFATIQPAELLKIAFIFYLAVWLSNKKDKTILPFFIIIFLVSFILYLQSDLSTFFIIIFISLTMYFLARKSLIENFFIWLIASGTVFLFLISPYRLNRLLVFLGITSDPLGSSYQIYHSLITIGSGGFFGRGLGFSIRNSLIPHPMSDSIFAIIAEEGGFFMGFLVLFLFLALFWQLLSLVKKNNNKCYQLILIGIAVWFLLQSLIHISSMIRIAPVTGVPLPLISYGGSHIIAEFIAIGLVFNVLKNNKK